MTLIVPFLLAAGAFAQSSQTPGVYEERPGFGLYAEWVRVDAMEFSYAEVLDRTDTNVTRYTPSEEITPSPIIGITGMLPFLWHNYLNLQATVGGQFHNFKLKTVGVDSAAIKAGKEKLDFSTFSFVIQGGPELGYPVWTDVESQQMLKPVAFGNILVAKTFNSNTEFTNDMMFALTTGGGMRYTIKRVGLTAGVKWGWWYWKPTYNDSESSLNSDGVDRNRMRMTYRQVASPYVDLKYSIF
jgi:hypothetical protein